MATKSSVPAVPVNAVALTKEIGAKVTGMLNVLSTFIVKTDSDYTKVGELQLRAKEALKKLDVEEKAITRPINEGLKRVRALFKGAKEGCEKVIAAADHKLYAYRQMLEEKLQAEQQAREQEAEKERLKLLKKAERIEVKNPEKAEELRLEAECTEAAPVIGYEAPKVEGLSVRKYHTITVTNENIVPREYMEPNLVKIRATLEQWEWKLEIPGIDVATEERSAAGGIR